MSICHLLAGSRDHLLTRNGGQVFNLQRLAVLTTALAQTPPDPDLIYEAMKARERIAYESGI